MKGLNARTWRETCRETKQLCITAAAVFARRGTQARRVGRGGAESTHQRGGRGEGFRPADGGVLCGAGAAGQSRENRSDSEARGQGGCADGGGRAFAPGFW